MYDQMTSPAKMVMKLAREEAEKLQHEYIGTEHLLLGLLAENSGVAAQVLKGMLPDMDTLRREVQAVDCPRPSQETLPGVLPFSPRARRVLETAMEVSIALEHGHLGPEHLLLGLAKEEEGVAARMLERLNIQRKTVRDAVLEFIGVAEDKLSQGLRTTKRTVWTHWYENGKKQSEGAYQDRKRQGHWTFWHEDGSIDTDQTGFYQDGEWVRES